MMIPAVSEPLALWLAMAFGWKVANDVRAAQGDIWKRVAYACRYGKGVTLTEALRLPGEHLSALLNALNQLVEEENAS